MILSQTAQVKEEAWHALTAEDVLRHLEVQEDGLSEEQAARRLAQYGQNQLQEAPRPTFWHMLWDQLNNFVVILLIVASIISALLGDYIEAGSHHGDCGSQCGAWYCPGAARRRSAGCI